MSHTVVAGTARVAVARANVDARRGRARCARATTREEETRRRRRRLRASSSSSEASVAPDDAAAAATTTTTTTTTASSRRRLLLAALGGAAIAETTGQVAERTLVSEQARLRLEQKRRELSNALASFSEQADDGVVTRAKKARGIANGLELELRRAGAIAALSALGAFGSRVITRAKQRPKDDTTTVSIDAASSVDDDTACLVGGACAPDWSVDDSADADADADARGPGTAAPARGAVFAEEPWRWKLVRDGDFDAVARTVVFSACYGGFFQPHWFNVLNSYDWSDLVLLPTPLELSLRALAERFAEMRAATTALTTAGVDPVDARIATSLNSGASQPGAWDWDWDWDWIGFGGEDGVVDAFGAFFTQAGGYSDPSLIGGVSLVEPLETASAFLAPLADQARSIHWSPYDRVGVVNADP